MPGLRERLTRCPVSRLQLLEELTARARNVNSARDAAFAVFHSFDDACGLAALWAIRALGSIHDLFAVSGFCDLGAWCHGGILLISLNLRSVIRITFQR